MKKIALITVLTFMFIVTGSILAFAHSGGTDSNGGHYNHKTGKYHYHNKR